MFKKKNQKNQKKTSHLRSTLYLKFTITYAIFGFLCVFITATLTSGLIYGGLKDSITSTLYKNATSLATDYLPSYFSNILTTSEIKTQLDGMRSYTDAAVWFVDKEGTMLASSSPENYPYPPAVIEDFNPAENGSKTYQEGNYHGYFEEDVLTLITPVVQ